MESELESLKDANDKKLSSLESKLVEVSAQIVSLKSDGNKEVQDSLKEVRNDLDGRLAAAESNLSEVRSAFEAFRQESTKQSQKSLKKLEEVSGQIKAFQDMSDGKVTGVLYDNENLKVNFCFTSILYLYGCSCQ